MSNATGTFVQPVLDFLTLNLGTEVTRGIGDGAQIGHLGHITHDSGNLVGIHVQSLDQSWTSLTVPAHEVPFLWRSNCFTMEVIDIGIELPLHWFYGHC